MSARAEQERPWIPGPDLSSEEFVLINPEGTCHLLFDDQLGAWFRIFEDRTFQTLTASEAVFLRPGDVDTIIRWTMMWCLGEDRAPDHSYEIINDLANSVKAVFMYLANPADHN